MHNNVLTEAWQGIPDHVTQSKTTTPYYITLLTAVSYRFADWISSVILFHWCMQINPQCCTFYTLKKVLRGLNFPFERGKWLKRSPGGPFLMDTWEGALTDQFTSWILFYLLFSLWSICIHYCSILVIVLKKNYTQHFINRFNIHNLFFLKQQLQWCLKFWGSYEIQFAIISWSQSGYTP